MGGLSTVWSLEPKVSLQRWMKLVGDFLAGPVLLAAVGRGFATDTARAWTTRIALWGGAGALAVLATHSLSGGAFLVALGLKAPHPDPQIMFAATSPAATVIAVFAAPVALLVYRRYGIWSSWWIATSILAVTTAVGMLHSPLMRAATQREEQRPDDGPGQDRRW